MTDTPIQRAPTYQHTPMTMVPPQAATPQQLPNTPAPGAPAAPPVTNAMITGKRAAQVVAGKYGARATRRGEARKPYG